MSSDQFMVRLMRRSDLDEVLSIHRDLFEVKYTRSIIESFLSGRHLSLVLLHVTSQAETLIGISVTSRSWVSICSKERTAYLATFGIHPPYQRRGLGAYLFKLTCRLLSVHFSIKDLSLHMLKSKTSTYQFYSAMGMTASSVLRDYYSFDDARHDAILMVTQIAAAGVERPDVQLYPEIDAMLAAPQKVWLFAPLCCHA
jgi:ribosomal protein S18 acetylase RimI-like enzyme